MSEFRTIENIIIIPCRKGSTRVKNKNRLKIDKKRLFEHTIISAKKLKKNSLIVLSSDDFFYKKFCNQYKINFHKRSLKNSLNSSKTSEVIIEILKFYEKKKIIFKNLILLQVTSPFRDIELITNGYNFFKKKKANAVCSVSKLPIPIAWMNRLKKDLSMDKFMKHKLLDIRSQNLDNHYFINGGFYMADVDFYKKHKKFYNKKKTFAFITPYSTSLDIDSTLDMFVAEKLIKYKKILKNFN